MVKRRKVCRRRRVMVARNRCALVDCHNNIVKGRVKCRRKVAGRQTRARVTTKRRRPCKCRKTPKRRVVKSRKRRVIKSRKRPVQHRAKRRKRSKKVYRKGSAKRCRSCGGRFMN